MGKLLQINYDKYYMGHFLVEHLLLSDNNGIIFICSKCKNQLLLIISNMKYYIWENNFINWLNDNPWIESRLYCNELIIKELLE